MALILLPCRYDDGGYSRGHEDYPGSVSIPFSLTLFQAGILMSQGLKSPGIPTMSQNTIHKRGHMTTTATLIEIRREPPTLADQITIQRIVLRAQNTAMKSPMRTQATRRITDKNQTVGMTPDTTVKTNQDPTATTGQRKITNQKALTTNPTPTLDQLDQLDQVDQVDQADQVNQVTNLGKSTEGLGIPPKTQATTMAPTTTMEVQVEVKKHQGRQKTTEAVQKTTTDHTEKVSIQQAKGIPTRTLRTMAATQIRRTMVNPMTMTTTRVLTLMEIPTKTTVVGIKASMNGKAMTTEAQSLRGSKVRGTPMTWTPMVGLIQSEAKSMRRKIKDTLTTSTNMINTMMTIQENTKRNCQSLITMKAIQTMKFPQTKNTRDQAMTHQIATGPRPSSSPN